MYPKHAQALRLAGVTGDNHFPKLRTVLRKIRARTTRKNPNQWKRDRARQTYFCLGVSSFWEVPLHKIIKRLRNKHNLKWLRFSMSHHHFSNLGELFAQDLQTKILQNVESEDYRTRPCNCRGTCAFNGKCRHHMVVYKATCTLCDHFYIGATQRSLKDRMRGHCQDVRDLLSRRKPSDTFANHMATHWRPRNEIPTAGQVRDALRYEILWQGNPLRCQKSFGKLGCHLCQRERIALLQASQSDQASRLMNSSLELYGGCRHKPRFHRLRMQGTDDPG